MKGKQFYLLLSILIASICVSDSCSAFDWHYKWTRTFGSSQDEDIKGIDVDAEGNLYVLGSYTGTFDGNIHRGEGDVYVRKYSTSGTVLWTKTFGGSSYDIAASIKVDSARDNVLIGGAFVGTVNLNPDGNATYQFKEAMYLLNLDKDGGFKWVKVFADVDDGFHGGGGIADIALDDAGNIYYCGLFGSDITTSGKVDFDPSTGTHIIQSTGRTDLFVSKMDAAGNYIWTYSYGEADKWTAGLSLKAYGGAVYVAGGTGGGNGDYWYSGDSYRASFILKLTELGVLAWKRDIDEFYSPASVNVAIDSNENILTCGLDSANTRNTLRQVIPSISAVSDLGTSLFVKKYDAVGNAVWIYGIGGWGANGAYSMALDKNNDIYVVGEFQGTIDFNPNGSNDFQHSHGATKDIFLTKLKSDGTYCYTTVLGGWQTERAQKTFIDPYQGDLYIAGFFSGGFNFDLTGGFDWRKSNGKKDAFVSRYSPNHAPNLQGPPVGRNVGTLETSYKFTATATDSDGDAIRYRFNWGDGKQTDWKSNNFASHRWLSPGTFCVKVQAIDDKDSVSDWSECANILIR